MSSSPFTSKKAASRDTAPCNHIYQILFSCDKGLDLDGDNQTDQDSDSLNISSLGHNLFIRKLFNMPAELPQGH
jgi:hypothetical protein